MKSIYKYILVVVVLFGLLLANELAAPKPINWRKTFSKEDKIPYGSYVVFDQLEKLNPQQKVAVAKENPYEYLDSAEEKYTEGKAASLVIIQSSGMMDLYEWDKVKDFVKRGNTTLIASQNLSDDVLDDLGIELKWLTSQLDWDDSLYRGRLLSDAFDKKARYTTRLTRLNTPAYFKEKEESNGFNTLGVIGGFHADFIEYKMGEGTLLLHANPAVFSNIQTLDANNYIYTFGVLSYLPQQAIIWDEYYKNNAIEETQSRSPLAFIFSQPALKWSLYLLIWGVVLFFIFRAKRRQRIIPVVKPLANTSLEFTETIGQLYFNKGNHYDIALKKIQYFTQHIYNRYLLRYDEKDPEFVIHLAEKSGVDEKKILDILKRISSIKKKKGVGPNELLELNQKIDHFYTTAK